jgi:hypothetical protein
VLVALVINGCLFGGVLLTARSPSAPEAPDTESPGIAVGASTACPNGTQVTVVSVQTKESPDFLGPDEVEVTVVTRIVNHSNAALPSVRVSLTYDPALRSDAEPITLPSSDVDGPTPPGGTVTQTDVFAAQTSLLSRYEIRVLIGDCFVQVSGGVK